ncbi:MAG: metalloregulator ArsR/SmtB family transcription factor [Ilumatobacter sp.]
MSLAEVRCCVLDTELSDIDADELAGVLKALADPIRIRLVSLIAAAPGGEACACDLPDAVDRSQPTVSHHLTQLVGAGLLEREQRGRWAWFRVDREQFRRLCSILGAAGCWGERRYRRLRERPAVRLRQLVRP